jgi:hypothetical protein
VQGWRCAARPRRTPLAEGTGAQFGMEHYQLLRADGPVPDGVLDDLFAGLRR